MKLLATIWLALMVSAAALAQPTMTGAGSFAVSSVIVSLTGQGDIVSGATEWHSCSNTYTAAYATGTNLGCHLTRNDGAYCDSYITAAGTMGAMVGCSTGGLNGESLATFSSGFTVYSAFAYDQSGNGSDELAETPPKEIGSAIGGVAPTRFFDRTSSDYTEAGPTNFAQTSGTIVWWMYTGTTYNDGVVDFLWQQPQSGSELSCQKSSGNNIVCGWYDSGNDGRVTMAATSSNWPSNSWHLWALRWNTTHTDLLLDGVVTGTHSSAPTITGIGVHMLIGAGGGYPPNEFGNNYLRSWGFWPSYISDAHLVAMTGLGS